MISQKTITPEPSAVVSEIISHRVAIAGSVTDAITGQYIAGAVVKIEGQNLQTQTREDGSFYFIDLLAGQYTLNISAPNLGSRYGTADVPNVTVQNDKDAKPKFEPQAFVYVKLSPTRLVGRVTQSGKPPIPYALVQMLSSETQTETDKEGNYVFSGIQAGTHTVQVSLNGSKYTQKVTLTAGQTTTAPDFSLVPSSRTLA